ncbi:hypothetical protein BJX62DRAFT_203585 [Aspergillus germanicus]
MMPLISPSRNPARIYVKEPRRSAPQRRAYIVHAKELEGDLVPLFVLSIITHVTGVVWRAALGTQSASATYLFRFDACGSPYLGPRLKRSDSENRSPVPLRRASICVRATRYRPLKCRRCRSTRIWRSLGPCSGDHENRDSRCH